MSKPWSEFWAEQAQKYVDILSGDLELTGREEARGMLFRWSSRAVTVAAVWRLAQHGDWILAGLALAIWGFILTTLPMMDKVLKTVRELKLVPSRKDPKDTLFDGNPGWGRD